MKPLTSLIISKLFSTACFVTIGLNESIENENLTQNP